MHPILGTVFTAALVGYAFYRKSLTILGILAAIAVAVVHAWHPWSAFYGFLAVFFLAGTAVTKIKHAQKSQYTTPSTGSLPPSAKAPPRTSWQVLANSFPATLFILLHGLHLHNRLRVAPDFLIATGSSTFPPVGFPFPYPSAAAVLAVQPNWWQALLNNAPWGVMSAYATAAADTFASELGILAQGQPVLLTGLLRGRVQRVPRGTNGGITLMGVGASAAGAAIIGVLAAITLPLLQDGTRSAVETRTAFVHQYSLEPRTALAEHRWTMESKIALVLVVTLLGVTGGLLDSVLGALFQGSVVDLSSGKVVEGEGGRKVLYTKEMRHSELQGQTVKEKGRVLVVGRDWLSNNGVNFVTGAVMVAVGLAVGSAMPLAVQLIEARGGSITKGEL